MRYTVRDLNLQKDLLETGDLEEAYNLMVKQRKKVGNKRVHVYKDGENLKCLNCLREKERNSILSDKCNCCCGMCGEMGCVVPKRIRIKRFNGLRLND